MTPLGDPGRGVGGSAGRSPIRLENDDLALSIDPHGAEAKSLVRKGDGVELLWQGDRRIWSRSSPLLFPIVGRVAGDRYLHEGREYPLPQHGFARDEEFRVDRAERSMARLVLEDREATRELYPFAFELTVGYSLAERRLDVAYELRNRGGEPMFFSIGAHPGFRCPLFEGEELADHELRFEREESASRQLLGGGLRTGELRPFLDDSAIVPLRDELFEPGAVVLAGLRSRRVALAKRGEAPLLTLDFEGWPYLGIWTKPGAPFLCLEPWQGVADRAGGAGELARKEGIVRLEAGGRWARGWSLAIGAAGRE
jgi:galactose mutarotase-like enzyme